MLFCKNTSIAKIVLLIYIIRKESKFVKKFYFVSVAYNIMKMLKQEASNSGQLLSK